MEGSPVLWITIVSEYLSDYSLSSMALAEGVDGRT